MCDYLLLLAVGGHGGEGHGCRAAFRDSAMTGGPALNLAGQKPGLVSSPGHNNRGYPFHTVAGSHQVS